VSLQALVIPLLLFVIGPWSAQARSNVPAEDPRGPEVPMAPSAGTWSWPVTGPVIRGFDPPASPFGAGHRGIDIAAPFGTPILAPEAGTVSYAGRVGGELFVTLDHGGGLSSTYSWLSSAAVRKGDVVAVGQPIGATGTGHPGSAVPHLHLGVRLDGQYLDPMTFLASLGVQDLIRLVPLAA
jgi:murein DD-endopeptidase MepM/ murein hydrolase activator NlpD